MIQVADEIEVPAVVDQGVNDGVGFLLARDKVRTASGGALFWGVAINLEHPALRNRGWRHDRLDIRRTTDGVVVSWCEEPIIAPSSSSVTGDVKLSLTRGDSLSVASVAMDVGSGRLVPPIDRERAIVTLSVQRSDGTVYGVEPVLVLRPIHTFDGAVPSVGILTWLRARIADVRSRTGPSDSTAAAQLAAAILLADDAILKFEKYWPSVDALYDIADDEPDTIGGALAAQGLADAAAQLGYAVAQAEAAFAVRAAAQDGLRRQRNAKRDPTQATQALKDKAVVTPKIVAFALDEISMSGGQIIQEQCVRAVAAKLGKDPEQVRKAIGPLFERRAGASHKRPTHEALKLAKTRKPSTG
jgi:hypothetical protein